MHALDLAPALRSARQRLNRRVFRDFLHPNVVGQQIAALAILKQLCESGLLPGDGFDFDLVRPDSDEDPHAAAAVAILSDQDR